MDWYDVGSYLIAAVCIAALWVFHRKRRGMTVMGRNAIILVAVLCVMIALFLAFRMA